MTIGLPLAAFAIFVLYQWMRGGTPAPEPSPKAEPARTRAIPRTAPGTTASPSREPAAAATPARLRGTIALILDDVGYDAAAPRRAASLGVPLSFAVIPGTPHGVESADFLASRGFEVLCHLPMEPEGFPGVSPGDRAILTSMSDAEIRAQTVEMLRSIPHAVGVNNHMGSLATTDRRVMANVLAALRDEGVFFVDSRTTARSVGVPLARELGIRHGERSVFLDDDRSEAAIRRQLALLAKTADETTAIGIGHLYPSTLRVLAEELPALRRRGYRFVAVSAVVR